MCVAEDMQFLKNTDSFRHVHNFDEHLKTFESKCLIIIIGLKSYNLNENITLLKIKIDDTEYHLCTHNNNKNAN